jgi:hypothetical protein
MRNRTAFAWAIALFASTALVPIAALASPQPPLPTCLNGLASQVQQIVSSSLPGGIVSGTLTTALVPAAAANPGGTPSTPTPFGATAAYCLVTFTYSTGASGPLATVPPSHTNAGVPYPAYSTGETQQVEIGVALPLSSVDGGTGGIEGNWTGGMMTTGGSGSSGEAPLSAETPYTEGLDFTGSPGYAIRQGFVATMTDTGQMAAAKANDGSSNWFLTTAAEFPPTAILHGPIADWLYRGTHYGKQWGDAIAAVYYGKSPNLHYYNGCSGGGNQGMGQLQNFGDEYDGLLIGAPAYRWNQLSLSQLWPALVWKKLVQLGGTVPTPAQESALNTAITAACDVDVHMPGGLDAVADGIVQDPRLCALHFSAQANVCGVAGAPAAPGCITSAQAAAFDRIWDGPRNSHGARIYYPYEISDMNVSLSSTIGGFGAAVVLWDHSNPAFPVNSCLFVDEQSSALGAAGCPAPFTPITYEDEATLSAKTLGLYTEQQDVRLERAARHKTKVIQLRGNVDNAIPEGGDIDYYNRVATWFAGGTRSDDYERLQTWYRLFIMPGVGHCTGALTSGPLASIFGTTVGPSVEGPFLALRNWVEHGAVPTQLPALASSPALDPGRTRPVCPFPEAAIYNGSGDSNDAANYHCGGSLQTPQVVCNDVRTVFGQENTGHLDFKGVGLTPEQCAKPRSGRHGDDDRSDEGED